MKVVWEWCVHSGRLSCENFSRSWCLMLNSESNSAPSFPNPAALQADAPDAPTVEPAEPTDRDASQKADGEDAAYYARTFDVRWADVDPNRHLRHSAYADYCTHVRLTYLADRGWPMERFAKEAIGPVILREETRYKREVELGDRITVDFRVGHMSKCGRKWTVIQHITRGDGEVAAVCTLEGIWIHLEARRPLRPPADLHAVMSRIVDDDLAVKTRRRR